MREQRDIPTFYAHQKHDFNCNLCKEEVLRNIVTVFTKLAAADV